MIRNKGLTCDASSPRAFRVLDGLPFSSRLDADMMARAPLRLPFLLQSHDSAALHRAARGKFHLPVELACAIFFPGISGLDTICNGILKRTPFVLGEPAAPRRSELVNS